MDNLGLTLDAIPFSRILQAEIAKQRCDFNKKCYKILFYLFSIEYMLKIESELFSLIFYKPIPQQNKKAGSHVEFSFHL